MNANDDCDRYCDPPCDDEQDELHHSVLALVADGRARVYMLLATIVAGPLRAEMLPYLHAAHAPDTEPAQAFDPSRWAARYEAVLGYAVPPHAGAFLHPEGLVGGVLTAEIDKLYAAAGYTSTLPNASGDHLANLLGCLAHLCAAESDAWEDAAPAVAQPIQTLQAHLLHHFLLPWLPPFVVALHHAQDRFYAHLGGLLTEETALHWESIADPNLDPAALAATIEALLPTAQPPDLDQSGTRELVVYFCRVNTAGWHLSARDLRDLGQQFGVAVGFGGRARQLETLLQTLPLAELPDLLGKLATLAQAWQDDYAWLAQDHPTLQPWLAPWVTRLQTTRDLLRQMIRQAQPDNPTAD